MPHKLAKDIVKGDIIILDMGYDGQTFCDEKCRVLKPLATQCLFTKEPEITFQCDQFTFGTQFTTISFKPDDKIEIP